MAWLLCTVSVFSLKLPSTVLHDLNHDITHTMWSANSCLRLGIDSYSHSFCSPVSTTHVQQKYSKYCIVFFQLLSQALLIADVCGFLVRFSSKIHGSLQCLQCQCQCHYSPQTTKQTNADLRNNESQTTVFLSYSSPSSPFSTFPPMITISIRWVPRRFHHRSHFRVAFLMSSVTWCSVDYPNMSVIASCEGHAEHRCGYIGSCLLVLVSTPPMSSTSTRLWVMYWLCDYLLVIPPNSL